MADLLPLPETKGWKNTVAHPKDLLAYLNLGCEIKQVGADKRYLSDADPIYYLIAPNMQWEFQLEARHVQALEALQLIRVYSGDGYCWISKADFNIPVINKLPESSEA